MGKNPEELYRDQRKKTDERGNPTKKWLKYYALLVSESLKRDAHSYYLVFISSASTLRRFELFD